MQLGNTSNTDKVKRALDAVLTFTFPVPAGNDFAATDTDVWWHQCASIPVSLPCGDKDAVLWACWMIGWQKSEGAELMYKTLQADNLGTRLKKTNTEVRLLEFQLASEFL